MWELVVSIGFCLGMWCSFEANGGYPTWEACDQERTVVIETTRVSPDKTLVVRCRPADEGGEE